MRRVVVGSRNRVVAPDGTCFLSGAELASDFSVYRHEFERADGFIWAWYALDKSGRPDRDATLRGTETVLKALRSTPLPGILLSTDAVFSGRDGGYGESDSPDPQTDYARIKLAQEDLMSDFVRLRFTTFGPSFSSKRPLLVELVAMSAITVDRPEQFFSPISTTSLNRVIDELLARGAPPELYHLTSERIGKIDCCRRLSKVLGVPPSRAREVDPSPLDLSLTSHTHNFAISDELALAAHEWKRRMTACR